MDMKLMTTSEDIYVKMAGKDVVLRSNCTKKIAQVQEKEAKDYLCYNLGAVFWNFDLMLGHHHL